MELTDLIRTGDIAAIRNLVEQDASIVNRNDPRGFPPIVMATYSNQKEIVEFLLERGAGVDARDIKGNTPLMGVSFKGYVEIASLLLDKGADINAQNDLGATALILSAMFGQVQMTRVLLEAGADASLKDSSGNDARENAKFKGFSEIVDLIDNYSQKKNYG